VAHQPDLYQPHRSDTKALAPTVNFDGSPRTALEGATVVGHAKLSIREKQAVSHRESGSTCEWRPSQVTNTRRTGGAVRKTQLDLVASS